MGFKLNTGNAEIQTATAAGAFRPVDVMRVRGGARQPDVDCAATEEPLQIRLHGRPFAVIMRTPGHDLELTAGFLLSERVIASADAIVAIEHCTSPTADHPDNIVNVTLADRSTGAVGRLIADRRQVMTTSSCGLCGRLTIESLRSDAPPLECTWTIDSGALLGIPAQLRAAQDAFSRTGGLHAAGLFSPDGGLQDIAEDVGRHNAVDKVIGRMLMARRLPAGNQLLFVSGRASYEIVQKAFLAGVPVLGAVSAPSTLAVDLARETGVTLVGFVRGDGFNIYAHPSRIAS